MSVNLGLYVAVPDASKIIIAKQHTQSFVSHFRNYQPRRLRFFNHMRAVKAKDWSKFYLVAVRSHRNLVLDLQLM